MECTAKFRLSTIEGFAETSSLVAQRFHPAQVLPKQKVEQITTPCFGIVAVKSVSVQTGYFYFGHSLEVERLVSLQSAWNSNFAKEFRSSRLLGLHSQLTEPSLNSVTKLCPVSSAQHSRTKMTCWCGKPLGGRVNSGILCDFAFGCKHATKTCICLHCIHPKEAHIHIIVIHNHT